MLWCTCCALILLGRLNDFHYQRYPYYEFDCLAGNDGTVVSLEYHCFWTNPISVGWILCCCHSSWKMVTNALFGLHFVLVVPFHFSSVSPLLSILVELDCEQSCKFQLWWVWTTEGYIPGSLDIDQGTGNFVGTYFEVNAMNAVGWTTTVIVIRVIDVTRSVRC